MATYREIHGKAVKSLSTDPSAETDAGQIWYNTASDTFKSIVSTSAWSTASSLITGRYLSGTFGAQTTGVQVGGQSPPTIANVEEYNGTGWSSGTAFPKAINSGSGAGTQTAGLIAGGASPSRTSEAWKFNGTAWTAANALPGAMDNMASCGTETQSNVIFAVGRTPSSGNAGTNQSVTFDGTNFANGPTHVTTRMFNTTSGAGTGTAGLIIGGFIDPSPNAMTNCEEYNGTSWTTTGSLNVATGFATAFGTQTNAVSQVNTPNYEGSEQYNGSTWTALPNIGITSPGGLYGGSAGATGDSGWISSMTPTFDKVAEWNTSVNVITAAAWASGGNYPINSGDFSGAGTQTSAIAFGGRVSPGPNAVTGVSATYDGASWTAGPSLTTARMLAASAKNGTTTAALCTGGSEPAHSDKCEEFNGSSWTEGPNYPTTAQFGDQGVGTQTAALISGGYGGGPGSAYLDGTSTYNGSSWTALSAPSNLQDSRFSATATGTSALALMMSGTGGAGKVESWNGSAWSEQAEAITSRTAGGSSGPSSNALYFGGEGPTGVTEGYDGTSWSTRPAMGTARYSMASCGTQTLALAIGGFTSSNSTEEYTAETATVNVKTLTQG